MGSSLFAFQREYETNFHCADLKGKSEEVYKDEWGQAAIGLVYRHSWRSPRQIEVNPSSSWVCLQDTRVGCQRIVIQVACLYVPECDPQTKEEFHEREDHAHLLKVINKIMYNFKYSLLNTENCNMYHILPFVWSGTREPWLAGRLDSPFWHWLESGNSQSRMKKGSSMATSRNGSNWMATIKKKSMSQLLGTGIVQREGYLSSKEAVSTMKC